MFWKRKQKQDNCRPAGRQVFMDNAAGTQIDNNVFKKMIPYFSDNFFNSRAIYQEGFDISEVLSNARKEIANIISSRPQEIIFCDGGTEANNLAIRGVVSAWIRKNPNRKPHIITSVIEHASVLETCHDLESKNISEVSYVSVDKNGILNLKEIKESINENTILVSISYVNGEIGVVEDIRVIAKTIRYYRKHNNTELPYFHTDAVQALNYFDIKVDNLGVDLMTLNASKIYGPKKIAILYKKTNTEIDPIITGGTQEFGLNAGTENIPYIVGLSEAIILTDKIRNTEIDRLKKLQKYAENLLSEKLSVDFIINGQNAERIPNIINISIPDLSSEEIVLRLDVVGIKVSMKSACKSDEVGDSHVVRALRDKNTQSIRFSFGRATRKKDIDFMVRELVRITNKMKKTFDHYSKK